MGLSLVGVVLIAGSFSLTQIVESQRGLWNIGPQFIGFVVFLVAGLAETRRTPLRPRRGGERARGRLPHRVLGHEVRHVPRRRVHRRDPRLRADRDSFLRRLARARGCRASSGSSSRPASSSRFFIVVRGTFPRPRYDQLMELGWKVMLPLSLVNLLVTGAIVVARAHVMAADRDMPPQTHPPLTTDVVQAGRLARRGQPLVPRIGRTVVSTLQGLRRGHRPRLPPPRHASSTPTRWSTSRRATAAASSCRATPTATSAASPATSAPSPARWTASRCRRRSDETGRRYPAWFRINFSRCIFCGFCEDACPTYAIQLTPDVEMCEYERHEHGLREGGPADRRTGQVPRLRLLPRGRPGDRRQGQGRGASARPRPSTSTTCCLRWCHAMTVLFYIAAAVAVSRPCSSSHAPTSCTRCCTSSCRCSPLPWSSTRSARRFVAALEVIVYAGAIMMLFVFAVMLLNVSADSALRVPLERLDRAADPRRRAAGRARLRDRPHQSRPAVRRGRGRSRSATALFGPYVLGVELASMLLLAGAHRRATHRLAARRASPRPPDSTDPRRRRRSLMAAVSLDHGLILAAILFVIGFVGLLTRRNLDRRRSPASRSCSTPPASPSSWPEPLGQRRRPGHVPLRPGHGGGRSRRGPRRSPSASVRASGGCDVDDADEMKG